METPAGLTPPIPPPPAAPPAEKVHWGWYVAGGVVLGIILCKLKMKMKCNTDVQKIKNDTAKEMDELFKKTLGEAAAKGETLAGFIKTWGTD